MRGDQIVQSQLLMAQAISALAEHIEGSTGFILDPIAFAQLPAVPTPGMIGCVTDSTVTTWGAVITGGGTQTVLAFYNGTHWTVFGA